VLFSISFSHLHLDHHPLPSFPTRRSSDLAQLPIGTSSLYAGSRCGHRDLGHRGTGCVTSSELTLVERISSPGSSPRTAPRFVPRSEEHTSELQSLAYLVCRLLLEKKK